MKHTLLALMLSLCLLFTAFAGHAEDAAAELPSLTLFTNGGVILVENGDEVVEVPGYFVSAQPGQTVSEVMDVDKIWGVMLEELNFAGWYVYDVYAAEISETCAEAEDLPCFDLGDGTHLVLTECAYSDMLFATEELAELEFTDCDYLAVAVWMTDEEYNAYLAETEEVYDEGEVVWLPSVTLFTDSGVMLIDGEEEDYEATMSVSTVEPGQTFGEALGLDAILSVTAEGAEFTGWTVYEVSVMETSETCVEEEGVLCYELFEGYHMVLREYTVCHELISTEELAQVVCGETDHVVIANFQ